MAILFNGKLKKQTLFISVVVILILFGSFFCRSMLDNIDSDEKAVNQAMARNSKALAKKFHMRPFKAVAMPEEDLQCLQLEFQIEGPLSIDQIRKILIDSAHDFLEDLNTDSTLCSYLENHCLNINEIEIRLFLIDSFGKGLRDPHIGIAEISQGKIEYNILIDNYDNELKLDIPSFISTINETYDQAIGILMENEDYILSKIKFYN